MLLLHPSCSRPDVLLLPSWDTPFRCSHLIHNPMRYNKGKAYIEEELYRLNSQALLHSETKCLLSGTSGHAHTA